MMMMASKLHCFTPIVLLLFFSPTPSAVIATEFPIAAVPSSELGPSSPPISAPPSYLPKRPKFPAEPPVLSPDISPLLPSPGRGEDEHGLVGSVPTIPSSQSPPNPDLIGPDSTSTRHGPSATANVSTANASSEVMSSMSFGKGFVLGVVLIVFWWS